MYPVLCCREWKTHATRNKMTLSLRVAFAYWNVAFEIRDIDFLLNKLFFLTQRQILLLLFIFRTRGLLTKEYSSNKLINENLN